MNGEIGTITIQHAGTYELSGALYGQVLVTADEAVELILAGADITAPAGESAIRSDGEAAITLTLAAGTENRLSDGASVPDEDAKATVYVQGPLAIAGSGALTVTAGANNGIQSRDSLTVAGGALTVQAANHALKSRGALTVAGSILDLICGGDGLCADNARLASGDVTLLAGTVTVQAAGRAIDAEGAVVLAGGSAALTAEKDGVRGDTVDLSGTVLSIDAGGDGVQAASTLTVSGGTVDIITAGGGGSAIDHAGEMFGPMMGGWQTASSLALDGSAKGLKSDGNIYITGGYMDLNTADDSIHAGNDCIIDGGTLILLSNDDAIHADEAIVINGGDIRILDCFEGIEAYTIDVNGGDIYIRSVNDGINANGPEMMFNRWNTSTTDYPETYFRMSGGSIDLVVTGNSSNMGDGVDSNGAVYIVGGELIVSTFGTFMENGIDTGGTLLINGGIVVAGGSATMLEGVDAASTQCSATVITGTMPNETEVTISDEDGNVIYTATMADTFNSLVVSHPDMIQGNVYTLTCGTQSFTLDFTSSTVVNAGNSGFGFGGPGMMGGPGGGFRP